MTSEKYEESNLLRSENVSAEIYSWGDKVKSTKLTKLRVWIFRNISRQTFIFGDANFLLAEKFRNLGSFRNIYSREFINFSEWFCREQLRNKLGKLGKFHVAGNYNPSPHELSHFQTFQNFICRQIYSARNCFRHKLFVGIKVKKLKKVRVTNKLCERCRLREVVICKMKSVSNKFINPTFATSRLLIYNSSPPKISWVSKFPSASKKFSRFQTLKSFDFSDKRKLDFVSFQFCVEAI